VCTNGDNLANAFVPPNEWELAREWPIAHTGVEVCVAHASAIHLEKTLSWSEVLWLLHRIVISDADRCVVRLNDSGLLCPWDVFGHCMSSESEVK
jgi:hypothetical protein